MFINRIFTNSRLFKKRRLFFFKILVALFGLLPLQSNAHPSPNSLVFLDVSPEKVFMEVQLPVPELELSFGNEISKSPETVVERFGPQLKQYLLAHIHAYANREHPWQVEITALRMDKGTYVDTNIPYWEVVAHLTLKPYAGETTRKFTLAYDVIMHQVINHTALISLRSDWETGDSENPSAEAYAIGWNMKENVVPPLVVNLGEGSKWKGFQSMVKAGMKHISRGTDHLMFLLVLLLPAPLLFGSRRWTTFGGTRYSIIRLLKIVTAFTLGHSLTLILGAVGLVRLPSQPVEVLIALSILVSAVHAIRPLFPGKEIFIAGGFGLVHGLAFASVLANLHLGTSAMVLSILGFNIGIELMQLFVIAVTVPWLIILSKKSVYRYIRIGGAVFATFAALAWMVQRISSQSNFLATLVEKIATYAIWLIVAIASLAVISLFSSKKLSTSQA